jgi:hypothetical protein
LFKALVTGFYLKECNFAYTVCSEVKKLKIKQIIKTVKIMHVHRESNRKSPKMGKYCPYHKTKGLGIQPNRLCTNKGSRKIGAPESTSGLGNGAYDASFCSGTYPMDRQRVEAHPWHVRFGVFRLVVLGPE